MKRFGIKSLQFSFFILSFHSALAQSPNQGIDVAKMQWQAKQVVPPSPDAAELGKYGNVPVSLYTGTPSISIPLLELKGNSLSLPVSLSYSASGYKPEDAASWVGSGWVLNAGGVITRSVMGNPDNTSNYYGVTNLLNPPNELDVVPYYYYIKDIQEGTKETQPDVYYYNFNGHSGKFIIRPDYTVAKTEKDLTIINPLFSGGSLYSFTVVDEQGITYVFDSLETTHMTPPDVEGQSYLTYHFNSAWYLTKMYSADGVDVALFDYYGGTNSSQNLHQNMLSNKSVSFTYGTKQGSGIMGLCDPDIYISNGYNISFPSGTTVTRKFLKKITFQKFNAEVAYVDLVSSTGRLDSDFGDDRMLTQVKLYSISNGTNKLVKRYDLSYGYFTNTQNFFYKRRLRLDSLRQMATDGVSSSPPAHVFTYNTNFTLPERFTASLDHWGFFNAQPNTSLVPNVWFSGHYLPVYYFSPRNVGDGANREAYLEGSSATLLTKIQYPTGGYTTFEYELNKAKVNNVIKDVGGVRIKQLIDYSFENKKATVKNYSYLLDDGSSSGNIGSWPDYRTNSTYHHYWVPSSAFGSGGEGCPGANEASEYDLYTVSVSANSIFGLGSFQGSHIGYSQVTESQVDLTTSQSLGKTVYNYYIGEYWEHNEDIRSGDLIKQTVFRNDNKILEETTNTYQWSFDYDIVAKVPKANDNQNSKTYYCQVGTNNYQNYAYWETIPSNCTGLTNIGTKSHLETYSVLIQNKQLAQQVHKIYDQLSNSYLITTKNFTYGNSAHNYPTLIEETTTNGDKVKTAIKYVADYASAPSATNTIAYNINYMQQKNMMGIPIEKLQYRQDANGSNTRYISGQLTDQILGNPSRIYFLESKPLLTSVTVSSISSNTFSYDSHYRLAASMEYDNLVNLNQQSKSDDIASSYIWDYDQVYPVASVAGATNYQIWYTSFESNGKGGFTFTGTPVTGTAITGNRYYNLTSSSISAGTNSSLSYILSYWRNSSSGPYSVSGSSSYKQGLTKNGWTYYEHVVTGVSTATITGSGNIDEVRLYPATAQMTTQTFDPLIGITSQCTANNQIVYYEYDALNRLINIKDDDGNIVKNFKYNYGLGTAPTASTQTLFYNASTQQNFIKQGCTGGTYGDTVTYVVPYGKHAAISQEEADSKAAADKTANGQAYANSVGLCRYFSASKHVKVFKNDCSYEQGFGGFVWYDIPFGRYKSLVSQADADAMAQAEVNTLGQAYANTYGSCSCASEGVRFINGNCESGQLHHGSSVYLGNGTWECSYYYTFTDAYVTGYYYYYSSSPCLIDD